MAGGEPLKFCNRKNHVFCDKHRDVFQQMMDAYATSGLHPKWKPNDKDLWEHHNIKGEKFTFHIAIIGAGISGMYLAWLIKQMNKNIEVDIYEANSEERLGGRIYTHYFGEKEEARKSYKYAELGAMRIPENHVRFFHCLNELGFSGAKEVLNTALKGDTETPIKLPKDSDVIKFVFSNQHNLNMFNGITKTNAQLDDTGQTAAQFQVSLRGLTDYFKNANPSELLNSVLKYWVEGLKDESIRNETIDAMIRQGFDSKTLRHHLHEYGLSSELINWLETIDSATGRFDRSLIEAVIDHSYYDNEDLDWFTVDKGMDRITDSLKEKITELGVKIHHNHFVTGITKTDDGYIINFEDNGKVSSTQSSAFDRIVVTAPFGAVRMWDLEGVDISWQKKNAIRSLQYDDSCKVAHLFSKKFWRSDDPSQDVTGGTSFSDLPSRRVVYPCYGLDESKKSPGAMLTSYTWAIDAKRMGCMNNDDRGAQALKDLDKLYLQKGMKPSEMAEDHASIYWSQERTALGTFSFYGPGQFRRMYRDAVRPEENGRIHFCGEHLSTFHPWIEGALRSAYRVLLEIEVQEKGIFDEELLKKWDVEGKRKEFVDPSSPCLWRY